MPDLISSSLWLVLPYPPNDTPLAYVGFMLALFPKYMILVKLLKGTLLLNKLTLFPDARKVASTSSRPCGVKIEPCCGRIICRPTLYQLFTVDSKTCIGSNRSSRLVRRANYCRVQLHAQRVPASSHQNLRCVGALGFSFAQDHSIHLAHVQGLCAGLLIN